MFHHYNLSKCYNDLNELISYPTFGCFKWISSPINLFEGLLFTAFVLCTSFSSLSIILCIVNWIVVFYLSKKQLQEYKKTFKDFSISYCLIPSIY